MTGELVLVVVLVRLGLDLRGGDRAVLLDVALAFHLDHPSSGVQHLQQGVEVDEVALDIEGRPVLEYRNLHRLHGSVGHLDAHRALGRDTVDGEEGRLALELALVVVLVIILVVVLVGSLTLAARLTAFSGQQDLVDPVHDAVRRFEVEQLTDQHGIRRFVAAVPDEGPGLVRERVDEPPVQRPDLLRVEHVG